MIILYDKITIKPSGIQQYIFIFINISLIRARLSGAYLYVCNQLKSAEWWLGSTLDLAQPSHVSETSPGTTVSIRVCLFHMSHPLVGHLGHSLMMKAEEQVLSKLLLISHLLTSCWLKQVNLT